MSSFTKIPLLFIFFLFSSSSSATRPHALVAPLTKDSKTLQYLARINQRTPSTPLHLVVDLAGRYLWLNCDANYVSSTYRPARCRSSLCSLAGSNACSYCFSSPRPGCSNNTCAVFPENPFTRTATSAELAVDALSLSSTDGFSSSARVSDPSLRPCFSHQRPGGRRSRHCRARPHARRRAVSTRREIQLPSPLRNLPPFHAPRRRRTFLRPRPL